MPRGRKIKRPKRKRIEVKSKDPNPAKIESAQVAAAEMEWLDLRRHRAYAPVSERTLRAWIHSPVDPLPAVRVKGKILVRRSVFDEWLERHLIKSLEDVDVDGIVRDVLEGKSDGR
jgi:hypothetical protein